MKNLRLAISVLAGVLIIYLLSGEINLNYLRTRVSDVSWPYLTAAFGVYFLLNVVRAFRFELLLNKEIKFSQMLNIVLVQNFFNVVLPFRIGELSYLHFVRKRGIGFGRNLASLIGARFLDLASIVFIFSVALIFLSKKVDNAFWFLFSSVTVLLILTVLFFILLWSGARLERFVRSGKPSGFGSLMLGKFVETYRAIREFRRRHQLVKSILLSLTIWLLTFLVGMFLFRGFQINFGLYQAVFAYAFPVVISFTPLYFFAGIGSYESVATLGLMLLGVSKETAINSSLLLHGVELSFVLILALAGYWAMFASKR